jgi:hypothetical protein
MKTMTEKEKQTLIDAGKYTRSILDRKLQEMRQRNNDQIIVKNLIDEAIEKRGKFRVCRIIKNSDIMIWCEPPGFNLQREYRIVATINEVNPPDYFLSEVGAKKSKEWKYTMVLSRSGQYLQPGTNEELKAFLEAILVKVNLSA